MCDGRGFSWHPMRYQIVCHFSGYLTNCVLFNRCPLFRLLLWRYLLRCFLWPTCSNSRFQWNLSRKRCLQGLGQHASGTIVTQLVPEADPIRSKLSHWGHFGSWRRLLICLHWSHGLSRNRLTHGLGQHAIHGTFTQLVPNEGPVLFKLSSRRQFGT